jgi:hypothetical protein
MINRIQHMTPTDIASNKEAESIPKKGSWPKSMQYTTTPAAHKSAQ